jgi:hypothetical protein
MLMQDLDAAGFALRRNNANASLIEVCIKWLANFHACFMHDTRPAIGKPSQLKNISTKPKYIEKIWPIGTYWHLATRIHEWESMPESSLKEAAAGIDQRLNGAQFQTLVHGDAKLANFCISSDITEVAALDFQYVGLGTGIKDLIYFLGSCINERDLLTQASHYLDIYLQDLQIALAASTNSHLVRSFGLIEQECRDLYCFAWADFERFLVGWAPEHSKLNEYSKQQTRRALQALKE